MIASWFRSLGGVSGFAVAFLGGGGVALAQHHHHVHQDVVPHGGHYHVVPHVTTHYTPYVAPHVHVVGTPVVQAAPPVVLGNAAPVFQGAGMVVANPTGNSGAVRFTLDGQPYNLEPGYQISLKVRPSYTVAFDRGDGTTRTYALADAKTFHFGPGAGGWDIKEAAAVAPQPAATPQPAPAQVATAGSPSPPAPAPLQTVSLSLRPTEPAAPAAVPRTYEKGASVQVAVESAEIKNGEAVLATAARGKTYRVIEARERWVLVDFGGPEHGWINTRDVRPADPADDIAPPAVRR